MAIAVVGLSSCSPGSLFSNSTPPAPPVYHELNSACAGMKLSSPSMDAKSFRELLNCFNAYGALDPFAKMIARLSDAQVEPLVDAVNAYVLKDRQRIFEIQQSYLTLDRSGTLQTTLQQFGNVLGTQQQDAIQGGVSLLREAYYVQKGGWLRGAQGDRNLLQALGLIAGKLTPGNVADGLDWVLTYARSRPFASLETRFGSRPGSASLRTISDALWAYFQDMGRPGHFDVMQAILEATARGDLVRSFDDLVGTDSETIQARLSTDSAIIKSLVRQNADLGDGITSLYHSLNTQVECLQGSQAVPNADQNVIDELVGASGDPADYMRKSKLMSLLVIQPFCDYPAGLYKYYRSILDFANLNTFDPTVQLLREFARWTPQGTSGPDHSPLIHAVIELLSDTGDDYASGVKNLLPALTALDDRGAIDDLLLLALLPRIDAREDFVSAANFLLAPSPALGGGTVYGAATDALRRASPDAAYALLNGLGEIVNSSQPLIEPALSALRSAFYANDVHPFVTIAREFLADAPTRAGLFDTVFAMSEMPEFRQSLALTSAMASDGRLRQLLGTLVTLFEPWATQGAEPVRTATEPRFVSKARFDLTGDDLAPFTIRSSPLPPTDPCTKLALSFNIADYASNPNSYDANIQNLAQCLQNTQSIPNLVSLVDFLRDTKIAGTNLDYFTLPIQLTEKMKFSEAALGYISDSWFDSFDTGQFSHVLDFLPLAIVNSYPSGTGSGSASGSVLQPLMDLLSRVYPGQIQASLRDLENFGARVLRRADAPALLAYADDLSKHAPYPAESPSPTPMDMQRLERWVGNKECQRIDAAPDPAAAKAERAEEIRDDFDESLNNGDMVDGRARQQYSVDEFMSLIEPILSKLRDPSQSVEGSPLIAGILNLTRYFTLPENTPPNALQHYTPEYFLKWLSDRSRDERLITYFYHDAKTGDYEEYPRVKVVNTLDRLELTLIDSNFRTPWPFSSNSSLQYTGELGMAWGDEPRELWPPAIQQMFPEGGDQQPKTLAEVVDELKKAQLIYENAVGLPKIPCNQQHDPNDPDDIADPHNSNGFDLPEWVPLGDVKKLKRALFNLAQVTPVMEENLPLTAEEMKDPDIAKKRPFAGGLKVLRDMFFEILMTTPPDDQNDGSEWKNNLMVVPRLAQMGILHAVGEKLRRIPEGGPEWNALKDAMGTVVEGGSNPKAPDLVNSALYAVAPVPSGGGVKDQFFLDQMLQTLVGVVDSGQDTTSLRQLSFYLLASAHQMNVIDGGIDALTAAIRGEGPMLIQHPDWVRHVLTSSGGSTLLRALYEDPNAELKASLADVLREAFSTPAGAEEAQSVRSPHVQAAMNLLDAFFADPANQTLWDQFSDRGQAMKASLGYQVIEPDVQAFSQSLLHFLEERPKTMSQTGARAAAERLRTYMAEELENGDLDLYISLIARDPQRFYQLLQTLASNDEKLQEFSAMVRSSLAGPPAK